ncbi:MAG: glycerol-3-phosphate dehydrogenase [Clostridiales bacterium]|nr:glycerol-3-phosphate dehydrogenase [Clostridiales bacterium]
MAVITIVGSGMMGSALAFPARENGHEVRLVGTHLDREIIDNAIKTKRHLKFDRDFPVGVEFFQIEQLEEALDSSDLVISGVSSFGVEWFGEYVMPKICDGTSVLTVTKGLQDMSDGRLLTYPEIWQSKIDSVGKKLKLLAVGGPCTSYELVAHDQTEVCFCGKDHSALETARRLMQTDYYHISLSADVAGIESAVALKNAYALAVALTVGINQRQFGEDSPQHYNSQAAAFYQAVREMSGLLKLQGAYSTDNLAVGVGDLYVTVYGGRTRLVGILLGRGLSVSEAKKRLNGVTLESLVVIERVGRAIKTRAKRGEAKEEDYPLLMHVYDILTSCISVNIPWDSFRFNNK